MTDEKEAEQDARAVLLEKVWATPAARPYLEEALAKTYPQATIPGRAERLAAAELMKKVEEKTLGVDKKLTDWEARQQHDRTVSDLKTQGFNDDDIAKIEKLMVDEGIGTHANAALVYKVRNTVAPPRTITSSGMQVPGRGPGAWGEYFNGIMGQDGNQGDEWRRWAADTILTDFANGQGKKWLDDNYWPASPWAGVKQAPPKQQP